MSRPRYKVFVSLQKDNSFRYYFEDMDPPHKTGMVDGINYGHTMLYDGGKKDFVYMMNPHDAIVYCNELNEKDESKPNSIPPLRTGGATSIWPFSLFR